MNSSLSTMLQRAATIAAEMDDAGRAAAEHLGVADAPGMLCMAALVVATQMAREAGLKVAALLSQPRRQRAGRVAVERGLAAPVMPRDGACSPDRPGGSKSCTCRWEIGHWPCPERSRKFPGPNRDRRKDKKLNDSVELRGVEPLASRVRFLRRCPSQRRR